MKTTRYPKLKPPTRVVRDFDTLSALVDHAHRELGATHSSGTEAHTKIYFPRGGQHPYEEATVWRKSGYWHAQGPGARTGVAGLPAGAKPLGARGQQRAAERPQRGSAPPLRWSFDGVAAGRKGEYRLGKTRNGWTVILNGATSMGDWASPEYAKDKAERYDAESGVVRDYIAVDRRDRVVGGPFKSHDEAKRAAGGSGVVQFVPAGSTVKPRPAGAREARRSSRRSAPTVWTESNTQINTWFERDRASVVLETLDGTSIIEWWDEAVEEAVQDGFLDSRDWHGSAVAYANSVGARPTRSAHEPHRPPTRR